MVKPKKKEPTLKEVEAFANKADTTEKPAKKNLRLSLTPEEYNLVSEAAAKVCRSKIGFIRYACLKAAEDELSE